MLKYSDVESGWAMSVLPDAVTKAFFGPDVLKSEKLQNVFRHTIYNKTNTFAYKSKHFFVF